MNELCKKCVKTCKQSIAITIAICNKFEKDISMRIRPAPNTCCPDMKYVENICIGCGKKE